MLLSLTKCQLVSTFRSQGIPQNFHRIHQQWQIQHMELEATAIPRHVKVQHIKGTVCVPANSVSRFRAVGLYHDLNANDHQQEFSAPFKPSLSVEPMTHTPLEVNEVSLPLIQKTLCKIMMYI